MRSPISIPLGALLLCLASAGAAGAELPRQPLPAPARVEAAIDAGEARVAAELLVHPDDVAGDGPVRVGVLLEIDPGWHVYGADPGELGLPTQVTWTAATGRVDPLPWPAPSLFETGEGEPPAWGYAGRVLLPALARFEPAAGGRRVRAEVELIACESGCVPDSFALERDVEPVSDERAAQQRALFAAAPDAGARGAPPRAEAALWRALLLGLLGGLVLNLMPCVLPVLALKAVAVAELARRAPREALPHAAAYTAGVVGSLFALGLCVVALRAAGSAVGWGFPFQEPRYLAALCAVLVLFAANLLGAFEFGSAPGSWAQLGASAAGARRSFYDGLLTVALATPCSAPFLGTAAGLAFASPAPFTLAVFLAIGVGLAAPLALVALLPGSALRLPRAGAWMLELRAGLGFVVLAVVAWLCWVLGHSLDARALAALQALLLGVAALAWLYGRLQANARAPRGAGAALLAAGALALALLPLSAAAPEPGAEAARAWSPEGVAAELAAGRPALVVFTADWCITCKVNERLVLAHPRVQSELGRLSVAVFEADWTRRDERIRAELARHGRAGVPVTLVFSPALPDQPAVLPELLTVERVLEALREADAHALQISHSAAAPRADLPGF
jgi:thiol:disulfide interchange protein